MTQIITPDLDALRFVTSADVYKSDELAATLKRTETGTVEFSMWMATRVSLFRFRCPWGSLSLSQVVRCHRFHGTSAGGTSSQRCESGDQNLNG